MPFRTPTSAAAATAAAGPPPAPQSFAGETPVYRRPNFDFSVTGLTYSGIMMFMGLAAVNVQASLLFGVFGLMIGIVLISGVISKIVVKKVSIRRLLPDQATVGEPTLVHYTVTNNKRFWASFSVTVAELDGVRSLRRQPQTYVLHAAPGASAAVVAEIVPKRRGIARFDRYQLSTSFPFGFIKRAVIRRQSDSMLVFPATTPVDPKLLTFFRSAEMTGNNLRPKPNGNDEFYGLRDYRPGESPRLIDWKRSARTGRLVSRELTEVSPPRIVVVVDTHNPAGAADRAAEVERSIAQAASLVEVAIESGLAVGLVVRSGDHWSIQSVKRGKRHKRELLSVLALLPHATTQRQDGPQVALAQASTIANNMTTLVLLTGGRESNLNVARRRGGGGLNASGITVAAESDEARRWFPFDPAISFAHAGPELVEAPRPGWLADLFVRVRPPAAPTRRNATRPSPGGNNGHASGADHAAHGPPPPARL